MREDAAAVVGFVVRIPRVAALDRDPNPDVR